MHLRTLAAATLSLLFLSAAAQVPDPLICEDSIDGKPPFQSNAIPCLVGCDCQITQATLSFLPGSINTTCIPYCNLDCVRKNPTPAQSALAPNCWERCKVQNHAIPEEVGWCMYWCVDGYTDLVTSTSCVPSLSYGAPTASVIDGHTVTVAPFTNPPEWQSWFQTQTVIPRTSNPGALPTPTQSAVVQSTSGARSSTPTASPTISPSSSSARTSSETSVSSEADSAAPTNAAAVVSRAHPLLLAALSFALYLVPA
ncbi:hypothetical protein DFH06DRAFT_1321797 [Mycena polygramma]|nr:hypothetical protein DFH06DRAFT_1321797 [Mycena polygramma]